MPRDVSRLAMVAIAAGMIVSLAGCGGTPKVSRSDVEAKTADLVAQQSGTGQRPEVSCPGDLEGKVGTTMQCTVAGTGQSLTLTVTSVAGKTVNFEVAGQPTVLQ